VKGPDVPDDRGFCLERRRAALQDGIRIDRNCRQDSTAKTAVTRQRALQAVLVFVAALLTTRLPGAIEVRFGVCSPIDWIEAGQM
jgi:hypothetical protein